MWRLAFSRGNMMYLRTHWRNCLKVMMKKVSRVWQVPRYFVLYPSVRSMLLKVIMVVESRQYNMIQKWAHGLIISNTVLIVDIYCGIVRSYSRSTVWEDLHEDSGFQLIVPWYKLTNYNKSLTLAQDLLVGKGKHVWGHVVHERSLHVLFSSPPSLKLL